MGMYTALHFTASLRQDTPNEVLTALRCMVDASGHTPEPALPDHPLFAAPRWRFMLVCDSYYFEADTHSTLVPYPSGGCGLSITSNFKNYNNELHLFLDWIMPYVSAMPGTWLGYHMYECDEQPTLIFYPADESS